MHQYYVSFLLKIKLETTVVLISLQPLRLEGESGLGGGAVLQVPLVAVALQPQPAPAAPHKHSQADAQPRHDDPTDETERQVSVPPLLFT